MTTTARAPLPAPRRPRTKIPSAELIVRTEDGGSISYITYLESAQREIGGFLRAVLGLPAMDRDEARAAVLAEVADVEERRSDGSVHYIGPLVAPVTAALDALLTAEHERVARWVWSQVQENGMLFVVDTGEEEWVRQVRQAMVNPQEAA